MVVVLIKEKVTKEDIKKASEEYGDFIKVDIDIKTRAMTIGGEWHSDGEKVLLENGSQQSDIWGGGISLVDQLIDYNSMINLRPMIDNHSQEILDKEIRGKFSRILKEKFGI